MDKLLIGWNSSSKHDHDRTELRVGGNCEELWQFVHNLLSMKRCAVSMERNYKVVKDLAKKKCLHSEAQSLRIATGQLSSDVQLLEKEIVDLKRKNSGTLERCEQLSFKVEVMKAKAAQCQEEMRVINEYSKKLEMIAESLKKVHHIKEKGYGAVAPQDKYKPEALTSFCEKEMKRCFVQLQSSGRDAVTDEERRQPVWSVVEFLVSSCPPYNIMSCMVELTHQDTSELAPFKRSTDTLLSSKFKERSKLQFFERRIQELQFYHVKKSQDIVKSRRKIEELEKSLEHLTRRWKESALMSHSINSDDDVHSLLLRLFQVNLEQCGYEAAVRQLDSVCDGIGHLHEERKKMTETLKAKVSQIQQFRKIVEEKESRIHAIASHNMAAREGLKALQSKIREYLNEKIHPLECIPELLSNLKDHVLREVVFVSSPAKQIAALPSNRTNNFKCPESFLSESTERQKADRSLVQMFDDTSQDLGEMHSNNINSEEALTILSNSRQFFEEHKGLYHDECNMILTKASKAVAGLSAVQFILEEWWNQPSQYIVHWRTFKDMNVEHWTEQWRHLATEYTTLIPQHQLNQLEQLQDTATRQ